MNSICSDSMTRLAVSIAVLGLAALVSIPASEAATRAQPRTDAARQSSRPAAPRGDYTRHTEGRRTGNGHESQTTWTDSAGRTTTRSATVSNDRENGTRSESVDWVGPNGATASRDTVTTRTDDGYTRAATLTNAHGETATRNSTVSRDHEAGTRARASTSTGFDGRQRSSSSVRQRTGHGYTRNSAWTYANGQQGTREVTARYDRETRTWIKDVEVDRPGQ